jgi:hypothetical protein
MFMKKISVIQASLFVLFIALSIHCGKGGDGGVFIPDLSLGWYNRVDATNGFFFLNAPSNVSSGSFTGNENPIGLPGVQYHFSGSFTNKNIQFTYDNSSGTKSGKSYSGTLNDASNEMTLSSSTLGSLVLDKR